MVSGLPAISTASGKEVLPQSSVSASAAAPFGELFRDAIGGTKQLEVEAHAAIDGLMRGNGVDVHQAMIAAQKATMGLDLVLAIRNKAIQSYQNVMSMQF